MKNKIVPLDKYTAELGIVTGREILELLESKTETEQEKSCLNAFQVFIGRLENVLATESAKWFENQEKNSGNGPAKHIIITGDVCSTKGG